jgi:hypothetical protein
MVAVQLSRRSSTVRGAARSVTGRRNILGFVQSNGIELAYTAFGDPRDPPMVLIQGRGAQMDLITANAAEPPL